MTTTRVSLIALIVCIVSTVRAEEPKFQQSASPTVRLTIRDKFGALGAYEATFMVTSAKGEVFTKTIRVRKDASGDVIFPDEFSSKNSAPGFKLTWAEAGVYTWSASVGSKRVIGGVFEFIGNGQSVVIRD